MVVIKKTIFVSFVQKLLWCFSVKRKKFAQTGSLLFDRHQLILVSKFCKIISSTVKTFLISSFNNSYAFNQSDIKTSVPFIGYKTVL